MTHTGADALAQVAAAQAGSSDREHGPCSLASLQQLSCLTRLDLKALRIDGSGWVLAPKGDDGIQDDHLAQLAMLSRLQHLSVHGASRLVTDNGLQALTQLTGLDVLYVKIARPADGVSSAVAPDEDPRGGHRELFLWSDLSEGPIWQQLATRCSQSPILHPDLPAPVVAALEGDGGGADNKPADSL
jgi:hypothetical protein